MSLDERLPMDTFGRVVAYSGQRLEMAYQSFILIKDMTTNDWPQPLGPLLFERVITEQRTNYDAKRRRD